MSNIVLVVIAASIAETATFPLDVIKTRLQLRSGTQASAFQQMKREGVRGLYVGLSAALLRHAVYTSSRISLYEHWRGRLSSDKTISIGEKCLIGAASGGFAQALATPADLLKVRLLADSRGQRRFRGLWDCANSIIKEGGVLALYRGAVPSILRASLVNLGELATYDQAKETIKSLSNLQEGLALHSSSSVLSGLVATTLSCPADVIKSRVMAQGNGSLIECLIKTVRQEGLMSLYRGFLPTWLRLGPWQLLFWTSYEGRQMLDLQSF